MLSSPFPDKVSLPPAAADTNTPPGAPKTEDPDDVVGKDGVNEVAAVVTVLEPKIDLVEADGAANGEAPLETAGTDFAPPNTLELDAVVEIPPKTELTVLVVVADGFDVNEDPPESKGVDSEVEETVTFAPPKPRTLEPVTDVVVLGAGIPPSTFTGVVDVF